MGLRHETGSLDRVGRGVRDAVEQPV
ncbi:MAG: hypothetical protein QOD70_3480, partial [Frankiales bacterium]|nr:hypothetical protein [Frankiales bacterium]